MSKRYRGISDSQANALALAQRERPYAYANAKSQRAAMARPRDLLAWFLTGFREEVPGQGGPYDKLHSRGVWRDARHRGDPEGYQPVGGSHLGSPRMAEDFRAYVEDDPFRVEVAEYEGHKSIDTHYRTPMRAALARLSGRGKATDDSPFMARILHRIALRDGDWNEACASMGIIEPVRRPYLEAALHKLWDRYREAPDGDTYRAVA